MLTYLLILHKVRDYSVWKRFYDAHLPKRLEASLIEKYLFRGAMEKAGVIDKPDVYFLNDQAGIIAIASGY